MQYQGQERSQGCRGSTWPDFSLALLPRCVTVGKKYPSLSLSFHICSNMGILGDLYLLGLLRP